MIHSQSFFIGGLENDEEARSNAFGAMGMFLFTFVASLVGMWYDSQYKAEPVTDEEEDEGEYHLSQGEMPSYGTTQ